MHVARAGRLERFQYRKSNKAINFNIFEGKMRLLCSVLLLWLVATLGGSRADYHSSHTNNWAVLVRKGDRARTASQSLLKL